MSAAHPDPAPAAAPDPAPAAPGAAGFPTRAAHTAAWETLARAIAARADMISETPPTTPPAVPGTLTIIGSGIESVGFVVGDEALIRDADAVFFCVADPATVVWIKTLRPDALDLYVLYDDHKVRYLTYMQMAEALLHPVRAGQRVTAIFYGHPGIFVLASHRAVLIARREGHRATLRPGISALDCLCADLGIDPAHPGLQTHEATDLLLRRRRPDTSLHVVLWQVGLIGELGFRRRGYLNRRFAVLLDYLQGFYGPDYPVVNYIASRYPGIPPLIDCHPLSALHDPALQSAVTGLSTFYLAPQDCAPVDTALMRELGLLAPGQTVRTPTSPLREIGRYGPRERRAFADFARFRVPADYQWQPDTAAGRFLLALRQDPARRDRYARDPQRAVSAAEFPGLDAAEQRLLATRDAGAIQVAAKGLAACHPGNQALLSALFAAPRLVRELSGLLARARPPAVAQEVSDWAAAQDHPLDWASLRADLERIGRTSLVPWAGVYGGAEGPLVVIHALGPRVAVWVDQTPIRAPGFRGGALSWRAQAGNPHHGLLRVDLDRHGRRRLLGHLWPAGVGAPVGELAILREGEPGAQHPAAYLGHWPGSGPHAGRTLRIEVADGAAGRALVIAIDDQPLAGPITLRGRTLRVAGRALRLARIGEPHSGDWQPAAMLPPALYGDYRLDPPTAGVLGIGADTLAWNGQAINACHIQRTGITWSGGPAGALAGQVTALLDPVTLSPVLTGWIEPTSGRRRPCTGRVPPPADLRRTGPEFGLSAPVWDRLVALAAAGQPFVWARWRKARAAADLLNHQLRPLLP